METIKHYLSTDQDFKSVFHLFDTYLNDDIIDNPLRFQGQYFDEESGLYYNRHRYYNPDIGRYLTPDTVKLMGGINGHGYVPSQEQNSF